MALKDWFGSKHPPAPPSIEDLMVFERWEEAEAILREKVKANHRDTRAQMKLAEVYVGMQRVEQAVDQYIVVADQWASEGFHDRSVALLYKAMKLNPENEIRSRLFRKIERFKSAKLLDASRRAAIDGLKSRERQGVRDATMSALEVERSWYKIERSTLVRDLDPPKLKSFFSVLEIVHLSEGEVLLEAGSTEEAMFLVIDGDLEVISRRSPSPIRSFGPGDLLGERSLFRHRPWPALYRAKERVVLLKLTRTGLETALVGNEDPRGFLDALREQQGDAGVVKTLQEIGEEVP